MDATQWLMISVLLNVASFVALVLARVARNELRADLQEKCRMVEALNLENFDLAQDKARMEGTLEKVAPMLDEVVANRVKRIIREVGGC